jgi:hypothetical protein
MVFGPVSQIYPEKVPLLAANLSRGRYDSTKFPEEVNLAVGGGIKARV